DFKGFQKAAAKLGGYPVVAKTLNSRQGRGVILVESTQMAAFIADNIIDTSQGLLIQAFTPPQKRRDIRAFVIGDQVVAAMELKPREGDFRSNIHLNGKGSFLKLEKKLAALAVKSSMALGLEISGADIMVDAHGAAKVIEVNYSPGFRGLEAVTGLDIASRIVQYVTQTLGGAS
ncbi:MAG: 30S ribosomal protein S6--L-glutamate ligase, partial [Deltaproteobacteria bacterium]|nr:30S ribosomal protein S6--L-glutamate ligase [Deltaproteobacteria bacterium]